MDQLNGQLISSAWFGVDLGKRGACALLLGDEKAIVEDVPLTAGDYDFQALCCLVYRFASEAPYGITGACLERPQSRKGEAPNSGISTGIGLGAWRTAFALLDIPVYLVHPATWKANCALTGQGKIGSLQMARALFPTADLARPVHDGRAEALLIAWWAATHLRRTAIMRRTTLTPILELSSAPKKRQPRPRRSRVEAI